MYVKDHMTKEPVTVTKDTKISKAVDIMSKGHFHRLPIVDESGRLIGLVTGGLVTEKSGANATSLSIYELNYLLSKTKVEDIMLTDVKTINQDAFIEEAAQKMLDEGISVLPVIDDDNHVLDLLGYKHQGTRFVFQCDDRPGFFAGIAQLLADNEANMEAMAVYHTKARGTEAVVKATGEISVKSMVDILVNAGYKLNNVTQTTKFGTTKTFDV